ncbi:hypothetical protein BG000_000081 [Podila horticola]|nr:hypothetical protein BG000_000081 [Podila horticola]
MSMSHQHHYHHSHLGSPVKQESPSSSPSSSSPYLNKEQIKQENPSSSSSTSYPSYHAQTFPIPPGQTSSYSQSSPYNINGHLMGLNMQSHGSGLMSGAASGAATPVLSNSALSNSSAPSSPTLNNNYNYNSSIGGSGGSGTGANSNSNANSPYLQHQQPYHQYQHSYHHGSNLASSGYYNSNSGNGNNNGNGSSNNNSNNNSNSNNSNNNSPPYSSQTSSQNHVQFSTPGRTQYSSLVPPLSETTYAQYHQLLASPFGSSASTPYHSNHSTPYSSMPASPTLEYQQLPGSSLAPKPKRRQVKNACVNCQKACKKCDEGRPCTRCVKYGLTDTCVDSTRKVRKKGVKRGPYKRRPPPSQLGTSSSVSTSPTMRNAVAPGLPGYVSEPVTAINSPTQSHMLPFTSTAPMGHLSAPLDFGYDNGSSGSSNYAFHSQRMESNYAPSYTPSYSGASIYASPYGVSSNSHLP